MSDPGRSVLFPRYQSPALAAEAREMSRTFVDVAFLCWFTGEEDPERAWESYFTHTQLQCRRVLDGLLITMVPEDRDLALELAASVEVFCLPSTATETRVFENPGEATGHLIGISPLTLRLSADIAFGMAGIHPYGEDAPPRIAHLAREVLDRQISSYVRALANLGDAPMPVALPDVALVDHPDGDWPHGQGPNDYRDTAMTFVIAHELAHLRHGHLFPAESMRARRLLTEPLASLLRISDEANEELAADASAFMPCYNYLVGTWLLKAGSPGGHALSPARLRHKREFLRVSWHSARRATEACQAYYSAVIVLGWFEWLRGNDHAANRLLTAGSRAPFVQLYVQRDREETLAREIGPFMWSDEDVAHRKAHDRWRADFTTEVMPELWLGMGREIPATLPDAVTGGTLLDRLEDPEVDAALADLAEDMPAEREDLPRTHRAGTLQSRIEAAFARTQAGDTAGGLTALEDLLPDVETATGHDSPEVLALRHNIAFLLGKTGRTREAAAAFAALLADQKRLLGSGHPDVLETRYNLASLRGRAGDAGGAAADFARLSADEERLQGHDHAHARAARNSLAFWRLQAEDPAGAAERVLDERERELGPDHAGTRTARKDLARLRREAVAVAERLLAEQEGVLGPEHPDAVNTRRRVAEWRGKAGDAAGAADAYADLLLCLERVLGPDAADTRSVRGILAEWRNKAARDGEPDAGKSLS